MNHNTNSLPHNIYQAASNIGSTILFSSPNPKGYPNQHCLYDNNIVNNTNSTLATPSFNQINGNGYGSDYADPHEKVIIFIHSFYFILFMSLHLFFLFIFFV